MGWPITRFTEIVRGAYDAAPEEMSPDAVYVNSRHKRIFRGSHPFGKLKASTGAFGNCRLGRLSVWCGYGEEATLHVGAEVPNASTNVNTPVAGFLVFAPFLPTYLALRVEDSVIEEVERAFEAVLNLPGRPPGAPGVFSISFGSMPALRLAASSKRVG